MVENRYSTTLIPVFLTKFSYFSRGSQVAIKLSSERRLDCRSRTYIHKKNSRIMPGIESGTLLILQSFRHFTYVTTHSPTLPLLYLRHSSFSNPSVASHTSQFILQPFFRFSYVTSSILHSPGDPPMLN